MKLILVSITVLILEISTTAAHSLSKIELKNPSDLVYKVEEDEGSNAITIERQTPEKSTLREIVYYHIIEKALGGDEEEHEGPDFDETRRPFTNSHGYQYLAVDPEDISNEEITHATPKDSTEATSEKVTTEATPEESTAATEIPPKRLKREAEIPRIPNGRELDKLNDKKPPEHPRDEFTVYGDGDSEDYSYENHSPEETDSGSYSNELLDSNSGPYRHNASNNSDDYGMQQLNASGYDWNNVPRPTYEYIGDDEPYSSRSESEENTTSEDVSDQIRDTSLEDSYSHEDSGASESISHESDSQSHEYYPDSVENSNEEDLYQSNDDLNSTNEPGMESNEISNEESYEDLYSTNEEAGNESNEASNEFDHIFSDITDAFAYNDSELPETEDMQKGKVMNLLKDIFDNIVDKQTNKPLLILGSEDTSKKSRILKILHGLFTNIIKNDITITNNMVSAKPDLVADKNKIENNNARKPTSDGTESPVTNDTETPVMTEINIESTTEYGNTDLTPTEDTTKYITNIVTDNTDITDTTTSYTVNDAFKTEANTGSNEPSIHENIPITTETPNTEFYEVVTATEVNQDTTSKDDDIKEPTSTDANTVSKPVHTNSEQPGVNKLDQMAELMNNEKFWTFMGDLAGKYLEQLMSRTGLFIKHEVEKQIKEYLQAQKEEESKEHKKEDAKEMPHDNDKVTNVYVFYLSNKSDKTLEEVKKIVNINNSTNIFTFGIDGGKDSVSKDTDNVSDVTNASGTDFTNKPSTVLIEATTANIWDSEPTTVVETIATTAVNNVVTIPHGVDSDEEKYHIPTTEHEFGTLATKPPFTIQINTVSDTTDVTDITNINNEITEAITPTTENIGTTTADEVTVTVTVSDSSDVTTESESITTPEDSTQVVINNSVSVPATESTTKQSGNELTTENTTEYTDSGTVVTDISENAQTTTGSSETITEVATENDISTTETSGYDITTANLEIISSTDSGTFTTQSDSGDVTTDSDAVTENISTPGEDTIITTETPEILPSMSTENSTAVVTTTENNYATITSLAPNYAENIDVTTVNDDITEKNNVTDITITNSDNIEANTERTNINKGSDEENKPDDNKVTTTEVNTSDNAEITTQTSVNDKVVGTEVTTDKKFEEKPVNSDANLSSKENISDDRESNSDNTTPNDVDKDTISSEDTISKPEGNDSPTDVTSSSSSEHN